MALLPPELKPMRWLAHVPLAILPFLAAAAIQGPQLGPDLERRVAAALAVAGQGWAKIGVLGRDVEIRGLAPDRASRARAAELAGAVAGVRRVSLRAGVEAQ